MSDEQFVKIAGNLLLGVRDLAEWGIDSEHLTEEDLRFLVLRRDPQLRLETAKRLIDSGMSQRQVAKVLGVHLRTVQRDLTHSASESDANSVTDPEPTTTLPTIRRPAGPLAQALKREAALREQLEITQTAAKMTCKRYGTIVIDPPWPMKKIEREERPNQVEFDYPTMGYEELREFRPKFERMADDACHVFMWTTQRFLPMALRLFEDYGIKYVLTMVWHKPGGFQPVGLPQYNCEFVLYGRVGVPEFMDTKAFNCCFEAPRAEHSRKPDEFYETVRRTTAGKRIDVFSREKRKGFDQFGNEPEKFKDAAE